MVTPLTERFVHPVGHASSLAAAAAAAPLAEGRLVDRRSTDNVLPPTFLKSRLQIMKN